jgi:hypothetical protein
VSAGKEGIVDSETEELIKNLSEVIVSGQKNGRSYDLGTGSARSFGPKEVNRRAGRKVDPSRLVTNFNGITPPFSVWETSVATILITQNKRRRPLYQANEER